MKSFGIISAGITVFTIFIPLEIKASGCTGVPTGYTCKRYCSYPAGTNQKKYFKLQNDSDQSWAAYNRTDESFIVEYTTYDDATNKYQKKCGK